jgi:hypothetical protein
MTTTETTINKTPNQTLPPSKAVYLTSLLSSKLGLITGSYQADNEDEYSDIMWCEWVLQQDSEGNPTIRVILDYTLSGIFIYEAGDASIDDDMRYWLLGVSKLYSLEVYALDPTKDEDDEDSEEDTTQTEEVDTPIPKHLH